MNKHELGMALDKMLDDLTALLHRIQQSTTTDMDALRLCAIVEFMGDLDPTCEDAIKQAALAVCAAKWREQVIKDVAARAAREAGQGAAGRAA